MGGELYSRDILHALADLRADLLAGVDRRMDDDAAGEGLVAVERRLPAGAEVVDDLAVLLLVGEDAGEAALGLDRLLGGVETGLGEEGGHGAVLRRAAGMEGLGHGAEHLAQARRLSRRQAERPAHLLGVQADGVADGG